MMKTLQEIDALMNLYQPADMKVEAVKEEAPGILTLTLSFRDPVLAKDFKFKAGQFGLYGLPGEGECVFCLASGATRRGYIECSFQKVGRVTTALRELNVGDTMQFRGPFGNWFPLQEKMKGHSILFIGMGIGLAPVRSVIQTVLDERQDYKDLTIIYGARNAELMVYKDELKEWAGRKDLRFIKTVDPGGAPQGWDGEVGFVPAVVEKTAPGPKDCYAVICGPPVGIKFTLPVLAKLGFPSDHIYTTLENRMKCGVGKCGRCNVGSCYVCKDGPVFTAEEIAKMPAEF
jgi:sulfhydrogenase subunit gamma (sulfur reductase)